MIDSTVPSISVTMIKTDMDTYPRYEMPEGFTIVGYQDGYEQGWAEIAKEQFLYETMDKALALFAEEFSSQPKWEQFKDSCLFAIEEKTGKIAAVLTLWEGGVFPEEYRRVHWVATREEFQGKGIIKAMMTYAMDLYHKQNSKGLCILVTGTPNWQAIRIYKRFGFEAYLGEYPAPAAGFNPEEAKKAWSIIDEKIAAFEASRK